MEPVPQLQAVELSEPPPSPSPRPRWGRRLVWLGLLAIAGYAFAEYGYGPVSAYVAPYVAKLTNGNSAPPPVRREKTVPVVAAPVQQTDMDLYLNGLGSISAANTVTVRSRVDGELMKIHFVEGQMVQQGDLLAEIDPRPFQVQLAEAQGQLTRDEATLWLAQVDLDRYTTLRARGSMTQQELDAQTALVKQTQGTLQIDQGQIDNAKLQLTYCRIIAPITGRIGLRTVDAGNMVHANDLLGMAVITQLQPVSLLFTIPQDNIVQVQKRMKIEKKLVVEAWDRDFKTRLATGSLLALDNQVDPTTGTIRLKATFDNKDELLFPNQFVNARLLIDTRYDAVVAPTAAIQRGPESNFVYVVQDDSTVKLRNVTVGQSEGNKTIIQQGLAPDEIVVTDGIDKLTDGAKVAVREKPVTPNSREPDNRISAKGL